MIYWKIFASTGIISSLSFAASAISCSSNESKTKTPISSYDEKKWSSAQDVETLIGSKKYRHLEDGYPARKGQSIGSLQPVANKVNGIVGLFYITFTSQFSNINANIPQIMWENSENNMFGRITFVAGGSTGGINESTQLNPHWEIRDKKAYYVFTPISKNWNEKMPRSGYDYGRTILPNDTIMYAGINYEGLPVNNPFPFDKKALKKITSYESFKDAWFRADVRNKHETIYVSDETVWKKYKNKIGSWFRDKDQTFHIPFNEILNFKIQHNGEIPAMKNFYQEKSNIPTPKYLKTLTWKVKKAT